MFCINSNNQLLEHSGQAVASTINGKKIRSDCGLPTTPVHGEAVRESSSPGIRYFRRLLDAPPIGVEIISGCRKVTVTGKRGGHLASVEVVTSVSSLDQGILCDQGIESEFERLISQEGYLGSPAEFTLLDRQVAPCMEFLPPYSTEVPLHPSQALRLRVRVLWQCSFKSS